MESCGMQARIVRDEESNYVMEVGLVPEPTQLYGIAALVAGESNMHRLQGNNTGNNSAMTFIHLYMI